MCVRRGAEFADSYLGWRNAGDHLKEAQLGAKEASLPHQCGRECDHWHWLGAAKHMNNHINLARIVGGSGAATPPFVYSHTA